VMPGFGTTGRAGSVPEVKGEMSDEKRARLKRTLFKRGFGGPPFQVPIRMIDPETEKALAALPEVESSRVFLQDRFKIEPADGAPFPARDALSLAVPAKHAHYPKRLVAGRWFTSDDEHAVVLHEMLLYNLGITDDAAQAAFVGRRVKLTAKSGGGALAAFMPAPTGGDGGSALFTVEAEVVGVIRDRWGADSSAFVDEIWGMQADVFVPQIWARELWDKRGGREGPRSMLLVAKTVEGAGELEERVSAMGLQVRSVREVFDSIKKYLHGATIAAGFLAGVAVFVAALGIVNTMVMSVLERTREIGLLKSLGATDGDVAALFLAEAGLLGLVGGAVGVALGAALGGLGNWAGRRILEDKMLMPFEGTLFERPWWLLVGGAAFAVVVGLVAALVPALRAARVNPVEALRHD